MIGHGRESDKPTNDRKGWSHEHWAARLGTIKNFGALVQGDGTSALALHPVQVANWIPKDPQEILIKLIKDVNNFHK